MKCYFEVLKKIEDFKSKYDTSISKMYFRGQSNYDWGLESSLQRIRKTELAYRDIYANKEIFDLDKSLFENLAYMQHYGMPTRALDYTYSVDIALFFACSENFDKDAALFGTICRVRNEDVLDVDLLLEIALLKEDTNLLGFAEGIIKKFPWKIYGKDARELAAVIGSWINHGLMICPDINKIEQLKKTNIRMYMQKGVLFVQGNEIKGPKPNYTGNVHRCVITPRLAEIPRTISDTKRNMKIRIPFKCKKELLQFLKEEKGIDETYIYPDKIRKV